VTELDSVEAEAIDRLELRVGRLLEIGVMLSSACLGVGLLVWMFGDGSAFANRLLTVGLVSLMLTPLARVVASLIAWIRLRDWFFVATTVMVFVVLIAAWLLKS
jgi:uncharacterized membrane protein